MSEGQGTLGRQAPPQPPSVHADYCSELLLGCSMSLRSPGTWILTKAKLIVHLRELLRSFWRHSRKKLICLEHLTTVSPKPTFPVLSPTTFPQKAETSPSPFPALAHPSHLPQEKSSQVQLYCHHPQEAFPIAPAGMRLSHLAARMGWSPSNLIQQMN